MENNEINVKVGGYEETSIPEKYLVTLNLDACVGVGLVADVEEGTRKRGLAHIHYDGSVEYDKKGIARLKKQDKERAGQTLEEIIRRFRASEKFPKKLIASEKIRLYIVANRTKEEKAKTEGSNEDGFGYINPMFDFIIKWLTDRKMPPVLTDGVFESKKEGDEEDKKMYHIIYKNMVLHHNNINLPYKNSAEVWLNPNTYSHQL